MSSLTHCNYKPLVDKIKRESGERSFPIWLLFNPKHPIVSDYIWTPVLTVIQDMVYRELHTRIDTTNIYFRNVVSDSAIVPNMARWWDAQVDTEIKLFKELVVEHKPTILITFGAFPYEFVRRVYEIEPKKGPKSWGNSKLTEEFGKSIANFDINNTNRIPLLRRMASTREYKEEQNQNYFENYIHYVGTKIAEKIIENKDNLNIWI
ncbi:MAG: hypothetical protein Q8912_09730 [Bacillota bacterium]|nr:hypothetical protein [Bacillota bacterium]MDP4159211.1 hypothetical protein [Bacillota bacterium]